MRVLMVSGEFPPRLGGVGDYTARLCSALEPGAVQVALLTSRNTPLGEERSTLENPEVIWRDVSSWGVGCWGRLARAADDWRADIVHIQYQAGMYQLKGALHLFPLWWRLRRRYARIGVTFHDLRPPFLFPKAGPLRQAAVWLLAISSHGVVCTEPSDLASLGLGPRRRHIPLGSNVACAPPPDYDRDRWRAARGIGTTTPLVGYFGFLNTSKGVETLLLALAQLPEARLALLGGSDSSSDPTDRSEAARLHELAGRLGVEERLWRSGPLPPDQLSAALLACDVVALPYLDGASGRRGSLLAALTHGRAIVTTRGPSADLLTQGEEAVLVTPGNPTELAAALRTTLADTTVRSRLERGAARLAQRFNWPSIASAHLEWYRELADGQAQEL